MPLSLSIAYRYLFGKKSTNAINVITGISVLGIAIGTAALIIIMSVLNGFEQVTRSYLDTFNPDIKIIPAEGKFFYNDEDWIAELGDVEGVALFTKTLEEVVLLEYGDKQHVGIIKGVDKYHNDVINLEPSIVGGELDFSPSEYGSHAVIGQGVSNKLNVSLDNPFTPIMAHVPKRNKKIFDKDFKSRPLLGRGVFSIKNERDNQYVITSYEVVSSLLDLYDQISAIELKMTDDASESSVLKAIRKLTGDKFEVLNRYEQDKSNLRIMKVEKWTSYLILGFVLILITFNVIGCLWMIVLEKKKDISVLQSFGGQKSFVKRIFYFEGLLISGFGFLIGFVGAALFYFLQKQFDLIGVPEGFAITSYPIEMRFFDVVIVLLTVLVLGYLASIPAAARASRVSAQVRYE